MIDAHSARFAQMVEAARGQPDIVTALVRAGFTAAEILDEHLDVAKALRDEFAESEATGSRSVKLA